MKTCRRQSQYELGHAKQDFYNIRYHIPIKSNYTYYFISQPNNFNDRNRIFQVRNLLLESITIDSL